MTDQPKSPPPDWTNVKLEMARQVLGQGENFMRAQLQVALDADKRAMTLASLLTTLATAILAATLGYWNTHQSADVSLIVAGLVASFCNVVAAGFCFYAARPTQFALYGNHPERWWPGVHGDLAEAMGSESENYQNHIEANSYLLKTNSNMLMWGVKVCLVSPIASVVGYLLTSSS